MSSVGLNLSNGNLLAGTEWITGFQEKGFNDFDFLIKLFNIMILLKYIYDVIYIKAHNFNR
jgi:hypothetical protein